MSVSTHELLDYEVWALQRLFNVIKGMPSPPDKAVLLFSHILDAYEIWYDRIQEKATQVLPWHERSLDECENTLAGLASRYRALLDGLTLERLGATVDYTTTEGEPYANTTREILQHVVLHSAYHRGQVNATIRHAGAEPAVVDFIYFLREKPGP